MPLGALIPHATIASKLAMDSRSFFAVFSGGSGEWPIFGGICEYRVLECQSALCNWSIRLASSTRDRMPSFA